MHPPHHHPCGACAGSRFEEEPVHVARSASPSVLLGAGAACRTRRAHRSGRRHGKRIKQTCAAPLAHRGGGYGGHGTDDGGTDNEDKRWRRWKPTRRRKMRRGLGATRSCPMRAHMTASLASAHKDARLSWWLVFQCKKLAARADNRVLSIDKGAEHIQYFVDFRPQE